MANAQSRLAANSNDSDATQFGYVQYACDEFGFKFPRLVMRILPHEPDATFYYHSDPTRPVYTVPLNRIEGEQQEDSVSIYKVQHQEDGGTSNAKVGSISFEYYPTCCVVAIEIDPKGAVFVKSAVAAVAFEETFKSLFFGLAGMGPTFSRQTVLYSYEDDEDDGSRRAEDSRKGLMESILLGMMLIVDQKHQLDKFGTATGNCLKITCKPKIKYRYNYQYEGKEDFKAPSLHGIKILQVHKSNATDYDITCSPSFTNELLAVAIAFAGRRYNKSRSTALFWVRLALILVVALSVGITIKKWFAFIFNK